MGVDAIIYFNVVDGTSDDQIKDLDYRSGDALQSIIWNLPGKPTRCDKYEPNIKPNDSPYDEAIPLDGLYQLNIWCSFYGEGYERGPWPELYGCIEWLRMQPIVSDVWYGGDCGGKFKRMDRSATDEMWGYFARVGRLPYLTGERYKKTTGTCPRCGGETWNSGHAGLGGTMFTCPGCRWSDWNELEKETPYSRGRTV